MKFTKRSMVKIIPTIFSHNKKEFNERFKKLLSISNNFQIDFMDGKFVPSKSINLKEIPNLKKFRKNFEAHLMCLHPEKYLSQLKKKGFKKTIFHIESTRSLEEVIKKIKSFKVIPFMAINPETHLEKILSHISSVKGILFMGVHPGKEHQKFIPSVYKKISQLRKLNKKIIVQVDGGVNESVAKKLAKLKVSIINSGSYISDSENPRETLRKLKSL